jgi:ribonucleoside-diphosphate reductase alpha chain
MNAVLTDRNTTTPARNTSEVVSLVKRYFTKEGRNPLDALVWEKRLVRIENQDGSLVFAGHGEVPEHFSQLATDIAVYKYFRKAGINGDKTQGETSFRQVVERVVGKIAQWGWNNKYFDEMEEVETFVAELAFLLANQYGAFNSPVWFNCGLDLVGVKGTSQSWVYSPPTSGENVTFRSAENLSKEREGGFTFVSDAYSRPQCSACFIQSVSDDLGGIYDLAKQEALLFKYGSGTGTNFSRIRGKQEKLSGGGTSSGLLSFLKVFDTVAGSTKSGGTTRRAAKMVCLDMDHPEIVEFITWKRTEEKKAKALIAAGYSSDFNGEAYATVSGQNSNNSVRVSDQFMHQVLGGPGSTWTTTARTTGEVTGKYDPVDMWNLIAKCAWECADPGVQYDDHINKWHTCPNTDKIYASNPCSEFMFLDDTACNLASLNLTKFMGTDGVFDTEGYAQAVRVFIIAQEILVGMSSYPTKQLAKNSHDYRPLGIGYANLGTLLMTQGIPYDSDEGRAWCSALTAVMTGHAYSVSADMAAKLGPFAGFERNRDPMLKVISMHQEAAQTIPEHCPTSLLTEARGVWLLAAMKGRILGYRNAQVSVLAPTGTIGLLMDCDTTGVEPDFSLVKFKKLAGGGSMKIVNQSVPAALRKLGYAEDLIVKALAEIEEEGSLEKWLLQSDHLPVFDCANKPKNGTRFIRPEAHLLMMAAAQPFLSGAISKTVNLPNEATLEEIRDIYTMGWKLGLKAVALYRDGCKASQPLNTKEDAKAVTPTEPSPAMPVVAEPKMGPTHGARIRLPRKRNGFTQESKIGGHKVFLRTGEYPDGTLGEIFVDMHKEGAAIRSVMNCFAISVSLGLQHGVPLSTYVEQFTFTRFEPQGTVEGHPNIKMSTSIVDFIFRVLGVEYLQLDDLCHIKPVRTQKANEEVAPTVVSPPPLAAELARNDSNAHLAKMMGDAPPCDQCGHMTVRNGSCYRCLNCGASLGCS